MARSVRSETNLNRSPGLWAPGPVQLMLPFEAAGLGVAVKASGQLALTPDLDILAWICERWMTTTLPGVEPGPAGEERHPGGVAAFTLYDIGQALYGRKPGGEERRVIRESLLRLFRVEISLTGYSPLNRRGEKAGADITTLTRLINTISSRELDQVLSDPKALGGLRGSSFKVEIAGWLREHLVAGNVTYLNWDVLRELDGVAKRTWIYLESETWKPAGDGLLATQVGLGGPALDTLGAAGFKRHRDARRALNRAGQRIVQADDRYAGVSVEKRPGGHSLVAYKFGPERLQAHRAEAQERRKVRDAIADSLRGDR